MIELLEHYLLIALILGVVSRYTCEGLINVLGLVNVWVKRGLVLMMNGFLVYWYLLTKMEGVAILDAVVVFFIVCAGTEAIHEMINGIKAKGTDGLPQAVHEEETSSKGTELIGDAKEVG